MKTLQESILAGKEALSKAMNDEVEMGQYFDDSHYVESWLALIDNIKKFKKGKEVLHFKGTGYYLIAEKLRLDRTIQIYLVNTNIDEDDGDYYIDYYNGICIDGTDYKIRVIENEVDVNDLWAYESITKSSGYDFRYIIKITNEKYGEKLLDGFIEYVNKNKLNGIRDW